MKYWMGKTAREVLIKYKNWKIYYDKYHDCNYTTSTDELPTTHRIEIYPNPTSGEIMVYGMTVGKVEVIDMLGRVVKRTQIHNELIDISDLDAGLYYLSIISEGRNYKVKVVLSQ
jgi:hypothetical protein